jgi:hypothetical protein
MTWTSGTAALRDWIALMNNLDITSALEIAVFGLAIVQMLTIVLTIRREKDVNQLRELVDEQRIRLAEMKAWLAGRLGSEAKRLAPLKPDPEPAANVRAPKLARNPEDDAARAAKAREWQQDIAARLQSGLTAESPPTAQATMPAAEPFKWFKDDPGEPPEIAEARRTLNGKTYQSKIQDSAESLETRPNESTNVEQTLEAIATRLLKEDTGKGSA